MEEARKYNVLPLDDRRVERFNSDLAGRPTLIKGNSQLLFGGMGRLGENVVLNIKNKSHSVTAELDRPGGRRRGRDRRAGRRLRRLEPLRQGAASRSTATTSSACSASTSRATARSRAATHQVRMEFAYDGGGLAKGGTVSLYVDGTQDRRGTRRGNRPDGLLGRRDAATSAPTPPRRSATTTPRRAAASPARRLGADRPRRRRRRPRPPDHAGGAPEIAMTRQ